MTTPHLPAPGAPEPGPDFGRPDYVVGFNPVPMANQVALLGGKLRTSILWLVLGGLVTAGLWYAAKAQLSLWWLVAMYSVSIVLLGATAVRMVMARRHLSRIGSGPALEAGRVGLVMHSLEGVRTQLAWREVRAVRTAGRKTSSAGPTIVVDGPSGPVWQMPLSFLDALPGTIDGGIRATSAGRFGLDLTTLDSLF